MRMIDLDLLISKFDAMKNSDTETAYCFKDFSLDLSTEWDCIDDVLKSMPVVTGDEDAISRQSAIKSVCSFICEDKDTIEKCDIKSQCGLHTILSTLPSVQPKVGHWIDMYDEYIGINYQCSCCGKKVPVAKQYDLVGKEHIYNFCPCCGAEMEA